MALEAATRGGDTDSGWALALSMWPHTGPPTYLTIFTPCGVLSLEWPRCLLFSSTHGPVRTREQPRGLAARELLCVSVSCGRFFSGAVASKMGKHLVAAPGLLPLQPCPEQSRAGDMLGTGGGLGTSVLYFSSFPSICAFLFLFCF